MAIGVVGLLVAASLTFAEQIQTLQFPPPPPAPPGAQAPQAPPRDTTAKTGTARIRGHVYAAESGQPLRKAQVRAFSPELRENRMTTTDASGAYEIKELPAGRYTLSASKGSFVSLQYGQTRPVEPGKPLQIADAQTVERVDFSLPRGSVITGRILDEFGEPTADVQVMAMHYQYIQGRRRLTPAGRPSATNDIGEFRIFGLPPGQYYLSATLRGMMMIDGTSDDRSGYAPTYYPGTANVAEAQRITVGVGQALSDINMSLVQTRTARISGIAVDTSGKPMSGGFVMVIQRNGNMFMSSGGGQIRGDGTFTISNLAPGEYTVQAQMPGGFAEMGATASTTVSLSGDDVTGVQLVATKPIAATGRVVVDPALVGSLQPSSLRIVTQPLNPEDMPMGPPGGGRVNDDFTFEIKSRPGRQFIRLMPVGRGSDLALKSVRYNGIDVTDTGIDFRPNEALSDIEIELTNRLSEIAGVVTNARNEQLKDYTVVIFAQDSQRWTWGSRYIGSARPDQDGRFLVRNLPPGDYNAIALDYVEPSQVMDPEFLERIQSKAFRFSLGDGETKTLDLKLSSST
jgi:hypothetical protein